MKRAKRIAIIFLAIIGLLVGTLAIAPLFFKDKIKTIVEEQANANLNATVKFDDFGLSFLRNFPGATISLDDYSIVGKGPFLKDTLVSGEHFRLVVDLMSVITGGDPTISKIVLDKPRINVVVLPDGRANYDIALPDTAPPAPAAEEPSSLKIKLKSYKITDGTIVYDDATLPMRAELRGINHSGKGDFTSDIFDLVTETEIEQFTTTYDGVTYLKNARLAADVSTNVAFQGENMIVQFGENTATLNALPLTFSGMFNMQGEDMGFNMKFGSPSGTFKDVFSLVPGVYAADFDGIKADGTFSLNGFVKGTYSETKIPGIGLDLKVNNGKFQYPDLPTAVSNINTDLSLAVPDGDPEKLKLDLRKFHIDLGSNPVDVHGLFEGLSRMKINAEAKAKLNLADLMRMFPVEGTSLRGFFALDAKANGVYDTLAGTFPKVNALMSMADGYVKQAEYPAELTRMNFRATLLNENGSMANSVLDVPAFSFLLDGEPLEGTAHIEDFDNIRYNLTGKGILDLAKLTQVYPIEGMKLKGRITLNDFYTSGSYADVEAEKYINLKTSGSGTIQGLRYEDVTLKYPVTIDNAVLSFTPDKINIASANGLLGKSDYSVDGYFGNYMAYALMDNAPLSGQMNLRSKKMNLTELMDYDATATTNTTPTSTPATTTSTAEAPASEMEVIPVPEIFNVNFTADIAQVVYDSYDIRNFKGGLKVANQAVTMQDVVFDMLGTKFVMNGIYDTKDIRQPLYNFDFKVDNLILKTAYEKILTFRALMPIAKYMDGAINLALGIGGKLRPDMMPDLATLNGAGAFTMLQAAIKNAPVLGKLSGVTKLANLTPMSLKDIAATFSIENGTVKLNPFDVALGQGKMNVAGSQRLDGYMDYDLNLDFPTGAAGQAAYAALGSLTNGLVKPSERTQVQLKVSGQAKDPAVKVVKVGSQQLEGTKQQAVNAAQNLVQQQTGINLEQLRKDSIQRAMQNAKQNAEQRARDSIASLKRKAEEEARRKAEEAKKRAEEEAKRKLQEMKNRFGLPK